MRIVTLTITAISLIPMAAFAADEFATPKQAEEMLAKAMSADKAAALNEITGKDKKWMHIELYPVTAWRASV